MNVLVLCYRNEPLREFALEGRTLEVGRAVGCDIVVHDPGVMERHLLLMPRNGTVMVHDLTAGNRSAPRVLPPTEQLPLGRFHSLVRIPDAPTRPRALGGTTEPIASTSAASAKISLVVGRGSEARRVALHGSVTSIGTRAENDIVVSDRAISGWHCRLEPAEDGWRVRDLGSRNGTYVDGVRITLARVEAGSTIRIGRTDLRLVARGDASESPPGGLIARSAAMRDVLSTIQRYAKLSLSVLVMGESGTGKEGIARALHSSGPRANGPFVAINAGGMSPSLVESELFGHERGAFTGAMGQHRGVFEQAHGGTLFFDEIGELPLDLQARLLRVLETWEVRRVGAERAISVDVRLVCATHRDLRKMVADGQFRQDLYYRIAHLVVSVPPLRDRPDDIAALAEHFLERSPEQLGPRRITETAIAALLGYDWPGNVRELRNMVLRAGANCAGPAITPEDVVGAFRETGSARPCEDGEVSAVQLERVLSMHNENLTAAARSLGLPRTTLRDRVKTARKRARKR